MTKRENEAHKREKKVRGAKGERRFSNPPHCHRYYTPENPNETKFLGGKFEVCRNDVQRRRRRRGEEERHCAHLMLENFIRDIHPNDHLSNTPEAYLRSSHTTNNEQFRFFFLSLPHFHAPHHLIPFYSCTPPLPESNCSTTILVARDIYYIYKIARY